VGAVLAVILACLTVEYFFMPPIHLLRVDRQNLPLFIEFAASAAVVGWFSSWRKDADIALRDARDKLQMRVDERTAELRQTNEQLLAEMAERKRAEEAYYEAQAELARVTRISALGALAAVVTKCGRVYHGAVGGSAQSGRSAGGGRLDRSRRHTGERRGPPDSRDVYQVRD
jgi:hypothetical protein